MKKMAGLTLLLCIGIFSATEAQGEKTANDGGTTTAADCDVTSYESYELTGSWWIPPCDPTGIHIGPLSVPDDGRVIADVITTISIEHTWIGDLMIEVQYDVDGDETPDAFAHPLCRHSLDGCPHEGCCGCSGDLAGDYAFQDGQPSIEDVCPSTFPPGCYGPDYDGNPLSVFSGLPTGGDFYFWIVEGGCGDSGTITQLGIHTLNDGGTPVDQTSWSEIKSRY